MDKQYLVHTYNGILLSNKKEWTINLCKNIDETYLHFVLWEKLVPQVLYYIIIVYNKK